MILSSAQEKADYEFVNKYWSDFGPMTYGRFDICDMEGNFDYSAARRFTEDRLEEIRQTEADIKTFEEWITPWEAFIDDYIICGHHQSQECVKEVRWEISTYRIIAILQAHLAELKKGMKI
jgi:hypothetical protein